MCFVYKQSFVYLAGGDFGPSQSYPITFTAGSVRQSVNIPIISDNVYELEETFQLEISVPEAAVAAGIVDGCGPYTPSATIIIADDDRKLYITMN